MRFGVQSGTEMLVIYSLALLIISIVVIAIIVMASLPSNSLPSNCNIYGGFKCLDYAFITSTSGKSVLIILASVSQPGTLNVSSFSAAADGIKSTGGYCSISGMPYESTAASQGQEMVCVANFSSTIDAASEVSGIFNVSSNYCPNAGTSSSCAAGSAYTFGGSYKVRAISRGPATTSTTTTICTGGNCPPVTTTTICTGGNCPPSSTTTTTICTGGNCPPSSSTTSIVTTTTICTGGNCPPSSTSTTTICTGGNCPPSSSTTSIVTTTTICTGGNCPPSSTTTICTGGNCPPSSTTTICTGDGCSSSTSTVSTTTICTSGDCSSSTITSTPPSTSIVIPSPPCTLWWCPPPFNLPPGGGSTSTIRSTTTSVSSTTSMTTTSSVSTLSTTVSTILYTPPVHFLTACGSDGSPNLANSMILTISNNENVPTPQPFQQQLVIYYPSFLGNCAGADMGNLRFYQIANGAPPPSNDPSNDIYTSNSELYAWCESGCDNSSDSSTFWIKLPNGIPAESSITIDVRFLSANTQYDGVYAGEAPDLSPVYGEYDNGGQVFDSYFNGDSASGNFSMPTGYTLSKKQFSPPSSEGFSSTIDTAAFTAGSNVNLLATDAFLFEPKTISENDIVEGIATYTLNTGVATGPITDMVQFDGSQLSTTNMVDVSGTISGLGLTVRYASDPRSGGYYTFSSYTIGDAYLYDPLNPCSITSSSCPKLADGLFGQDFLDDIVAPIPNQYGLLEGVSYTNVTKWVNPFCILYDDNNNPYQLTPVPTTPEDWDTGSSNAILRCEPDEYFYIGAVNFSNLTQNKGMLSKCVNGSRRQVKTRKADRTAILQC